MFGIFCIILYNLLYYYVLDNDNIKVGSICLIIKKYLFFKINYLYYYFDLVIKK